MSPAKQRLAILGATGSVGVSTLDVVARHPDRFEVFALTAQHRSAELEALLARRRDLHNSYPGIVRRAEIRRRAWAMF